MHPEVYGRAKKLVVKDGPNEFFAILPEQYRPTALEFSPGPNGYRYLYMTDVRDAEPGNCDSIRIALSTSAWRPVGTRLGFHVLEEYMAYVCSTLDHVKQDTRKSELRNLASAAMNALQTYYFTTPTSFQRCRAVHGDLTLENVLIKNKTLEPIFIDTGFARGMICKEIDESKLLQSLWLNWPNCDNVKETPPLGSTLAHVALCATHWIRLQRYWHRWSDRFYSPRITSVLLSRLLEQA